MTATAGPATAARGRAGQPGSALPATPGGPPAALPPGPSGHAGGDGRGGPAGAAGADQPDSTGRAGGRRAGLRRALGPAVARLRRRLRHVPGLRHVARLRRPSTPSLLRLGMALACLPVAFFAAAVQLGVARNDGTVRTVGRDAIQGITAAQSLRLHLAELDALVVRNLLEPVELGESGFPAEYDDKRTQLHDNLVLVASDAAEAAAYRQPLVNIEYAVAHYHTLVKEAFAARQQDDRGRAAELYDRAHDVMEGTLLEEADFVDKANTYVLNDTYDRQTERSASTVRLMVVSWLVLLAFLAVVQLLVARRFRRLLNLALLAATLVGGVSGGFALTRLDRSTDELTTAREEAFDSVHVLARARSTVVSARQAEGQLLLDPAGAAEAQAGFDDQTRRLFRVQGRGDAGELAEAGAVPDGAGGYLATVAMADDGGAAGGRGRPARQAVVAFGGFVAADDTLRAMVGAGDVDAALSFFRDGVAFTELTRAIDEARDVHQETFDRHARAAAESAAHVDQVTAVAAGAVLLLVIVGLYQRLREYGA